MKRLDLCVWMALLTLGCGRQAEPRPADPAATQQPAADQSPAALVTNSIGMKLARIPAGEFLMGSPDSDKEARDDEKPQHRVRITRPFHIGVYEVTQAEYERVMGTASSFFSPTGPGKKRVQGLNTARFPAEQVRWHDAVDFCRRLSERPDEKQAKRVYRLPTEAEWEYACRAGTTTAFHCGDSLSSTQANFNGNFPYGGAPKGPFLTRTNEVGSYAPNAFGLFDTHGNVWEWCADWHDPKYYRESPTDDPPGPTSGSARVIRGGEWYGDARDCRSAFRYADQPNGVFYVMGFRVVMTLADTTPAVTPLAKTTKPAPPTATIASPTLRTPSEGEDWPRWRGPRGDGTWKGPKLPERWPAGGLRCLWRQPIGGGYAGVSVSDGRVYTLDYLKEPEEIERVLCYEAATGKLLWTHSYPVKYGKLSYGNGPRAAPTLGAGRLYTLGALGHLHCLDPVTGAPFWVKDLVREHKARLPGWGFSAAPLLLDELLILHVGAEPNGSIMAVDQKTGNEVWRSLPEPAGYATPIVIDSQGSRQLVCWTPNHVRGLEPRTGKLLWSLPFEVTYSTSIATPIFHDGLVLVSGYYEGSKAIRLGPTATDATLAWEDKRNLRGLMSQPLYRDGHAYLLDKRNGLTCFEFKTGAKLWDDDNRSTPKGRNPQATLVWLGDDDRALILNSEGDLILARLNPKGYQELARTNIIGPTWAHPAYAGDCVYARSDSELVCVSLVEANPSR